MRRLLFFAMMLALAPSMFAPGRPRWSSRFSRPRKTGSPR